MNVVLWVLQAVGALVYTASGVMKVFMFEKISADVKSFGALPPAAWKAMGVVELVCVVGLVAPGLLHLSPLLTVGSAAVLALESLVFIYVHVTYRELPPIIMSTVLGVLMAVIAVGRY
jgi:uncharacterized membrane protein YphA (DoxX/SURF4 family)